VEVYYKLKINVEVYYYASKTGECILDIGSDSVHTIRCSVNTTNGSCKFVKLVFGKDWNFIDSDMDDTSIQITGALFQSIMMNSIEPIYSPIHAATFCGSRNGKARGIEFGKSISDRACNITNIHFFNDA